MKTIKELEAEFKKFWDLEWLNFEGDIRGFSFKFYKEAHEQSLKDVLKLIDERIKVLKAAAILAKEIKNEEWITQLDAKLEELGELKARIEG